VYSEIVGMFPNKSGGVSVRQPGVETEPAA
jgi:hypothetical protein